MFMWTSAFRTRMAAPTIEDIPSPLKGVLPFIKTATEFENRDPLVAYYCRTYAMHLGIKVNDKTNPQSKTFLLNLMTYLESFKKDHIAAIEGLR